jgi:hypothetical protein
MIASTKFEVRSRVLRTSYFVLARGD